MECSIIGSFRKYYEEVTQIIDIFKKTGIDVLSPKKSEITDEIDNFVILQSDKAKEPIEIQLITLNRILRSDFVYVYNPSGYVGKTTCYELGKIEQKNIPIFYFSKPRDLPILVYSSSITSPESLSNFYKSQGSIPKRDSVGISENVLKLHKALLNQLLVV